MGYTLTLTQLWVLLVRLEPHRHINGSDAEGGGGPGGPSGGDGGGGGHNGSDGGGGDCGRDGEGGLEGRAQTYVGDI